ncbi:MAG: hypothetical protein JSW17_00425 [Candidatus Omnitrophota bacterium]|nr:MAG: hypothetical protein JSW17_00425 [Candidatus Omnitrophota bacterium]
MKKALVLVLVFIIIGCASTRVKLYTEKTFEPTMPAAIRVLKEMPLRRNFIEIGEITVSAAENWREAERILRIKAAKLGADAVYVSKTSTQTRRFVRPHDCYFLFGYGYPHGHHHRYHHRLHFHHGYYRHYGRRYPHRYFYCYGAPQTEEVTFMTVTGIAIKYK